MRLIDADALMDEIFERYCKECVKRKGIKNGKYRIIYEVGDVPCRACEMGDMKSELEEAPTIEPFSTSGYVTTSTNEPPVVYAEQKHGKWVKIYDKNFKCSACGGWWTVDRDSTMKDFVFCPSCGAQMDLGEENGTSDL